MKTSTFFHSLKYLLNQNNQGRTGQFCLYRTQLTDRAYFGSFVCIINYNIVKCIICLSVCYTHTWVRTKTLLTCKCCNRLDSYVSPVFTLWLSQPAANTPPSPSPLLSEDLWLICPLETWAKVPQPETVSDVLLCSTKETKIIMLQLKSQKETWLNISRRIKCKKKFLSSTALTFFCMANPRALIGPLLFTTS